MLTDTHCHLDLERFDSDREAMVARALRAGVKRMLVPGINLESSQAALTLAKKHTSLFAAAGIHPTEVMGYQTPLLDEIRGIAGESKVVAIGEIGLDYYWDTAPHELQKQVFRNQLDLAASMDLPAVIHFREKGDAQDGPCASDILEVLGDWIESLAIDSPIKKHPGVLHSFSGSLDTAREALKLHFLLGITGPVTYRKDRQELVTSLPLESFLIETDAPFLAPLPYRGKRNEPAYVGLIADTIGVLHSVSSKRVAEVTGMNARELFHW